MVEIGTNLLLLTNLRRKINDKSKKWTTKTKITKTREAHTHNAG